MVLMNRDRGFGDNTNLMHTALGLGLLFSSILLQYYICFDIRFIGMWLSLCT